MIALKAIDDVLRNNSTISGLASSINFGTREQEEMPLPAVVYELISVTPVDHKEVEVTGIQKDRMTFVVSVWDRGYNIDLANEIRNALHGISGNIDGVDVIGCRFEIVETDYQINPDVKAVRVTFNIVYIYI